MFAGLAVIALVVVVVVVLVRVRRATLGDEVDDFSRSRSALGAVVRKAHDDHPPES